jgi:actin-related protein
VELESRDRSVSKGRGRQDARDQHREVHAVRVPRVSVTSLNPALHNLIKVYVRSLLTDPKSRKVILVEHPLLPLYIKEIFANVLFGNLQVFSVVSYLCSLLKTSKVPSVSFASNHLLSLLCVGRITGLVIDCGHLESTALPVCCICLKNSVD